MSANAIEVNFDAIVGPTHNYAGLAWGNLASAKSAQAISNPRKAALEGLAKMKVLMDLGLKQAVLPPQDRPDLNMLRRVGFSGTDAEVLQQAHRHNRVLLAGCWSASAMWAANAATVSPSADTPDRRVHLTPANLVTQFHRSLEAGQTAEILRVIFPEERYFAHHPPLPAGMHFCDEGAANHMRVCPSHARRGVEVFVWGREALAQERAVLRYPARQTLEASAAIARLHALDPAGTLLVQQSAEAIEAGVFHNDVVAVANENVLLCHQRAFANHDAVLRQLGSMYERAGGAELFVIDVKEEEVPLDEAVQSYLFNSQIVTLPNGGMTMIAPTECREHLATRQFLESLPARDTPIQSVQYVEVRQSMRNGGGPACLRLRVVLTPEELAVMHQGVLLNEALYGELVNWVGKHYRCQLGHDDLTDIELVEESRTAMAELMKILGIGISRDALQRPR